MPEKKPKPIKKKKKTKAELAEEERLRVIAEAGECLLAISNTTVIGEIMSTMYYCSCFGCRVSCNRSNSCC